VIVVLVGVGVWVELVIACCRLRQRAGRHKKCARNLRPAPPQQKFGGKFESSASIVKPARTVTYQTEARVDRQKTFPNIPAMAACVLTQRELN
jgi:hypothetical protein